MEQQKKIISIADLPQVRVLGRTTGKDVINLFWTGSGRTEWSPDQPFSG